MIKIESLTKNYGKANIFKNANYTLLDNGLVCLLGPSGCGKSTLLNLIAGFDSDYSGHISVEGKELSNFNLDELCKYRKDNIGFIFQEYNLITGYTVIENVLLPCDLYDTSNEENLKRADELLEKLGVSSKKNEKIENLSGGQKQRVAIARALMKRPKILLADEPTGALDRNTSDEIMKLLKLISEDIMVLVITHDKKVSSFADEIIKIENNELLTVEKKRENREINKKNHNDENSILNNKETKVNTKIRAKKNFKVHIKQFITVAIFIAFGISSFMLSILSQDLMKNSIEKFKEKNTAFNNGYIKYSEKSKEQDIFNLLEKDTRVSDVYYQYKLKDVEISLNEKVEKLQEYIPMPKTTENLSYGIMPRNEKNEIAITPSLAKKLNNDISKIIGENVILKVGSYTKELTVSGIYNAGYDSIFLSSNIEKSIYKSVYKDNDIFSLSYDVNTFEDVSLVNDMLLKKDIESTNASKEVNNLINTFKNINRLFFIVSVLIFLISLFLSVILLNKLQTSRVREFGLLSALGFNKKQIKNIILRENIILAVISASMTLGVFFIYSLGSWIFSVSMHITLLQLTVAVAATVILISAISSIISNKLVKIQPAKALRM